MKLHYIEKGTGPCRIWLHGFLGNSLNFANYANRIPGRHLLVDARNHGRSFHHEQFDYNTMAQDVIHFMDSMKISSTALCGYSMGAKTAMTVACRIPDRISKLVILDSMPVNYGQLITSYFRNLENYVI
jgi:esterase